MVRGRRRIGTVGERGGVQPGGEPPAGAVRARAYAERPIENETAA